MTLPSALVELELHPVDATPVFVSSDFSISVSTNNPTGYTLSMQTSSTDLTRTEAYADADNPSTAIIPTN